MNIIFAKTTLRTMAILVPVAIMEIASSMIQKNIPSVDLRISIGLLTLVIAIAIAVILNRLSYSKGGLNNNLSEE